MRSAVGSVCFPLQANALDRQSTQDPITLTHYQLRCMVYLLYPAGLKLHELVPWAH